MNRHACSTWAIIAALALWVGGCTQARPTVEAWQPVWDEARAALPSLDEDITAKRCTDALGHLRALAPDLESTPDPALDSVVNDWLDIAESAVFECPPRPPRYASFEEAYAEMHLFETEIEVVLEQIRD